MSCVIPVYQAERFLAEALASVFAQSLPPWEVIVVDDGSTDRSVAIARSYGDRVQVLQRPHQNSFAARDAGVRVARGELVAFLDADDFWLPEKLEQQVRCFAACPELDLCNTRWQNFWMPELADEAEALRDHALARPSDAAVLPTLMVRRALFEHAPTLDASGGGTSWVEQLLAQGARLETVPRVLMRRRFHRANTSRTRGVHPPFFAFLKSRLEAGRGSR